jgi:hypothetical protein
MVPNMVVPVTAPPPGIQRTGKASFKRKIGTKRLSDLYLKAFIKHPDFSFQF